MKIWERKRIIKRISAACMALGIVLFYPLYVYAAAVEISIENCRAEDGMLLVYTNDSLSRSEQELDQKNFQITLGDQEIPCLGVKYHSDTDEPVSYIYLVDVSGSMNEVKLQNMKEFLKAVTRQLREQDEICLVTFADNLAIGGFTKDHSEIERQIDGIAGLGENTNLYQGIVECLQMLEARDSTARKALVILSDGEEVQPTGITKDEVISCVKDTRIPVYTAAMVDDPGQFEQQESAKILGSFARESAGGVHIAFGLEDISFEEGASRITSSIGGGMIISGDLSEYRPGNGQAYLQVILNTEGKGKAKDGYMISEHELGLKAEAEEEKTEEAAAADETESKAGTDGQEGTELEEGSVPKPAPNPDPDKEKKTDTSSLLPLIAVALVFGGLLFVLMKKIKDKNRKTDVPKDLASDEKLEAPLNDKAFDRETNEVSGKEAVDLPIQEERPFRGSHSEHQDENGPQSVIYLTKIGLSEEKTYKLHIQGETTLGRQNGEAHYAFPEDPHMSGVHCSLICYDGKIILQDKGSRNGTWINGVPVTQPYALKCDDVLHIGKTDFRVHW